MKTLRNVLKSKLQISKNQASALMLVAQHELTHDKPIEELELMVSLEMDHGLELEAALDAIEANMEKGLLRYAPQRIKDAIGEDEITCHPEVSAFFRTGAHACLTQLSKSIDGLEELASVVEAANEDRLEPFYQPIVWRNKVLNKIMLVRRTELHAQLSEVTDDELAIRIALLVFGQYALDRQALNLEDWVVMMEEKLGAKQRMRNCLHQGHPLVTRQILNLDHEGTGYIRPTQEAIKRFNLQRDFGKKAGASSAYFLTVSPQSQKPRALKYDHKTQEQIDRFERMLEGNRLEQAAETEAGRTTQANLSVMFSGPSGTGKTSLVYELARKSGREVLHVSLEALRDKYMGESEKRTAALFREIKTYQQSVERCPIVLLDEADGFLHARQAHSDQTETHLITILLRELDRFQGILMATSNCIQHMDAAFARRFLFKVSIPRPDLEARVDILLSQFPGLSAKEARRMSLQVAFTPAHVELIARQFALLHLGSEAPTPDPTELQQSLEDVAKDWNSPWMESRPIGYQPEKNLELPSTYPLSA